jgi:signal transduction histidine kinase
VTEIGAPPEANPQLIPGPPHALASYEDLEDVASSAARWVRGSLGPGASAWIGLPDRAGRLRMVWKAGEGVGVGRNQSARRRLAFVGTDVVRLDLAGSQWRSLAVFPLVSRGVSRGILEVVAPGEAMERRWDLLEAIARHVAIALENVSLQRQSRLEGEGLDRATTAARALVRSTNPDRAVHVAVRFFAEQLRVPAAGWLVQGDSGRMTLTAVGGLGSGKRRQLHRVMGYLLPWPRLPRERREELMGRFGDLVGTGEVRAIDATHAFLLIGTLSPPIRASVDIVGSLLESVLGCLAATARAERADERLELGVAWMAHEFRGPLLAVKTVLEQQLRGTSDMPVGEALLGRSLRELEQLAGTTEGLLRWAVGIRSLRLKQADVVEVVADAVRSCWPESEKRVLVFAPPRAMARVDSTHLGVAVANLVRNALTYSDPETKVEITTSRSDGMVRVNVTSMGATIPEAERESIFDPFARGSGTAGDAPGSGLGLFMARRVVEAHGGRIWADSDEGGTTFHLQVPTARVAGRSGS